MSDNISRSPHASWADLHSASAGPHADDDRGFRADVSGLGRIPLRAIPAWHDGGLRAPNRENENQGAVSGGRGSASGGGGADGDTLRQARGRGDLERPHFDIEVPPGGYAWWYIDGVSDDGTRAVSVIGFIGSVFSPWYAWSGRGDPSNHCCMNVATYGRGGRFAMTDRGHTALRQTSDMLTIGPSSLHWTGTQLVIDVDEISSLPIISRMRGRITLTPPALTNIELPLTADGAHIWRPFAPIARISVDLEAQGWQFDGHGYFDSNFGTRALEEDFSSWTWARYPTQSGATCFYDAERRDGTRLNAAIGFTPEGQAAEVSAPDSVRFNRTLWALPRSTRADPGCRPKQIKSMLDAPFYSRSVVETMLNGERVQGVHEALDLNRFASPVVKSMLACRVPRRAGWKF